MSTLSEMNAAREKAVTDYAAKWQAFRSAFVELAAYDIALANRNLGNAGAPTHSFPSSHFETIQFQHPDAMPSIVGRIADDVTARVHRLVSGFTAN
jgi:hypothetical protein